MRRVCFRSPVQRPHPHCIHCVEKYLPVRRAIILDAEMSVTIAQMAVGIGSYNCSPSFSAGGGVLEGESLQSALYRMEAGGRGMR
jgi:hypothetical protein